MSTPPKDGTPVATTVATLAAEIVHLCARLALARSFYITCPTASEELERHASVEVVWRAPDRWAICHAGDSSTVWSRSGACFTWEPMPSSRTPEHLADTRFSLEDALEIAPRAAQERLDGMLAYTAQREAARALQRAQQAAVENTR